MAVLAYHGTTANFDKFNIRYCNTSCSAGRGFYFTSNKDSAISHSSFDHPDTRVRKNNLKRKDYFKLEQRVLITAELNFKNPAVINFDKYGKHEQYSISLKEFKVISRKLKRLPKFQDEFSSLMIKKILKSLHYESDQLSIYRIYDIVGDYMSSYNCIAIKSILRTLGFDSVIMLNPHKRWFSIYGSEQIHYIAYKSNQIKILNKDLINQV